MLILTTDVHASGDTLFSMVPAIEMLLKMILNDAMAALFAFTHYPY